MNEEKQKWLRLDADDGWQIIVPDIDSKPHISKKTSINNGELEIGWMDCECNPKVNAFTKMIIHNSFIDKERINQSFKDNFNSK